MAPFHANSFTNTGGSMNQNHGQSNLSSSNIGLVTPEALEIAGRCTESMLALDAQFPTLAEKLRIGNVGAPPSLSGLQEGDYPSIDGQSSLNSATHPNRQSNQKTSSLQKVPLPPELVEHFGHMQANCMIGLFPQIERAWLTIDSDIYVWRFADCQDLAYFDGLSDTIVSVALLTPKSGIFRPHIKYLLCLTTAVEIILLGVTFTDGGCGGVALGYSEMQLLPEPLFTLSTDSTHMLCVRGTANGRIFLGGKDGCLYEFTYKPEEGWFGKKAQKINHSTSTLSFLVPAFVNAALSEEDPLVQIEVDDSRNLLYCRSEKGTIQMFDLGSDGWQLNKIMSLSQQTIVREATKVALNIEKSNFFPIVSISAMTQSESSHLGLVAVTACGVRFYFGSAMGVSGNQRPTTLALQHIRLPPGFTASHAAVGRPSKVHISYYNNGTVLLSCAQTDSTDHLWLLSNDCFPFQNILSEGQSTLSIDGKVWALEEIPHVGRLNKLYKDSFNSIEPPLAAVQHAQPARKFVLISAQGTHIVSKLRPCDQLRQLLIEHGGPDNENVKFFFSLYTDVQASATCLVLACSRSIQDQQVSEWATRAFLLYGGDPKLVFPSQQQQQQLNRPQGLPPGIQGSLNLTPNMINPMPMNTPGSPSLNTMPGLTTFHPNIASTPAQPIHQPHLQSVRPQHSPFPTGRPDQHPFAAAAAHGQSLFGVGPPPPMIPEIQYSGKHNGLYLYFSRLIRPFWLKPLVAPSGEKDVVLTSSISSEEIDWIIQQLTDLQFFLERNTQFGLSMGSSDPSNNGSQQDALLRERQSLMFLQQLITHTLQVLGLWMVVCDHQFHIVAAKHLNIDELNAIKGMYFRDLIISAIGREICGRLVQAVIGIYLGDNAKTDAISNRLREVCPGLYNNEDAISSKAHEMIIGAKLEANIKERNKIIKDAISLCKDVASKLNLEILVSHLIAVHSYIGVLEICLASASKRDPQGLALHYYKNGEPPEDLQGSQAFATRSSSYKHITRTLKGLMNAAVTLPSTNIAGKNPIPSPGPPLPSSANSNQDTTTLGAAEAEGYLETVFHAALRSDDELFHVELYRWLLSEKLYERLLNIKGSIYLEDFLTRGCTSTDNYQNSSMTLVMYDLLWKYYEKNKNYSAAAKILAKLAERHSTEFNLKQRVENLSRAIICIKSAEVSMIDNSRVSNGTMVGSGELLHELEEKMEVARVQLQLVEAIGNLHRTQDVEASIAKLNADLLDISQLYAEFAEPYNLWECQLAILHCAGHPDSMLIETVWNNIIDGEMSNTAELSSPNRINIMANKIAVLGKLYSSSHKYFPLEHIVRKLELLSVQIGGTYEWVFAALMDTGIALPKIFEVYNKLYSSNEPIWLTQGCPHHLLNVIAKIIERFADSPSIVSLNERRQFNVHALDIIGNCLGYLYTRHDSNDLVQQFRAIQAKLERLESSGKI